MVLSQDSRNRLDGLNSPARLVMIADHSHYFMISPLCIAVSQLNAKIDKIL
jgi:hypothetical protein